MAQTDRQTDNEFGWNESKPATHWKTAIFDVEGSNNFEKLCKLPSFVKLVRKQHETCPKTGRGHWQIHVECHRQVRRTQMSEWIKQTKWFGVIGKVHIQNSIDYVSKSDSATPGTQTIQEGEEYMRMHDLLLCIARAAPPLTTVFLSLNEKEKLNANKEVYSYKRLAPYLVAYDLKWISKLSNPAIEKGWNLFHAQLFEFLHEELEEGGGSIIEAPSFEVPSPVQEWLGD